MPFRVDGIDYTPEGIEALRRDVIVYRNRALDAMAEGAEMAVVLSHAIALLAYLGELVKESNKIAMVAGENNAANH